MNINPVPNTATTPPKRIETVQTSSDKKEEVMVSEAKSEENERRVLRLSAMSSVIPFIINIYEPDYSLLLRILLF